MDNKYDLLIIGSGPAGLYAGYYASYKGLKPLIIEASDTVGGQPITLYPQKEVHDFPAFNNIKAKDLMSKFKQQFNLTSNDILLNTKIQSYIWNNETNTFKVNITNKQIECSNIIVAIGIGLVKPNKIQTKFEKNIHYIVRDFDEYKNLDIIILGGGDSAIDWANELSTNSYAKSITIIHRREEFRASGKHVESIMANAKVNIMLNKTTNVLDDNTLEIIDNKRGSKAKLKFDKLIVQYGQSIDINENTFLKHFDLSKNNKIKVNYVGATSVKNIYAIGSIAFIEEKPNLIAIAVADAIKAIDNIIHKKRKYE